ncbi:MAG: hypothetical protein ACYC0N_02265 [Carboxydocellales bacterium]
MTEKVAEDIELRPLDMLKLAREGYAHIPVGNLCYLDQDERIEKLAGAFIDDDINPDDYDIGNGQ